MHDPQPHDIKAARLHKDAPFAEARRKQREFDIAIVLGLKRPEYSDKHGYNLALEHAAQAIVKGGE